MELVLHLGAHRTGCTALRRSLMLNAERLEEAGFAALPSAFLREMPYFGQVPHLSIAEQLGKPHAPGRLQSVRNALAAEFQSYAQMGRGCLVLSEENMIGEMYSNLVEGELYPTLDLRLGAYAKVLPQAPKRIGIGLRCYTTMWVSAYTYVLPRRPLPRFDILAEAVLAQTRGWADMVRDVARIFPQAEIVLWSQEDAGVSVLDRLVALLGCGRVQGLRALDRRVNLAGDGADYELIHHLRAAEPELAGPELRARLEPLRGKAPSAPPQFSPAEAQVLQARYDADLTELKAMGGRVRMLDGAPQGSAVRA